MVNRKSFPNLSSEQLKFGIRPISQNERLNQSFSILGFDTETLPFRYLEIPDKNVTYNDLVSIQISGERFSDFHYCNFDPGLFRLSLFPDRSFIFAHNLPFDLGAILGEDYFLFLDEKRTVPWENGYWTGFIRDGTMSFAYFRYFEMRGKKKKKTVLKRLYFIDTGNYFGRKPLDSIVKKQFPGNPEFWKLTKPEYLGSRLPKTSEEWEYFEKYALQDSVSVRELGKKIIHFAELEGIRPKPTPAGFSSSVFLNKFLKKPLFYGSMKQERFIWSCYHGGRFEPFGRGTFDGVSLFDFSSLYPYSMTFPLPFNQKEDYEEFTLDEFENDPSLVGWGTAKFSFPNKTVYPSLPVSSHKLFFPLMGWTRATSYEFRFALEQGATLENFRFLGFHPGVKETEHPLKSFTDEYYSRKLDLDRMREKDGDGFPEALKDERDLVKLKLNSLYGKFAERHPDPDGGYPKAGRLFFPPFASLITGKSREILARSIVKYHSIYSDTDSIATLKKPDKKDFGLKLGQLKVEIKGRMTIVRSKQYRIIDKKGRLKGAFHSFRSPMRFFSALDDGIWEYDQERMIKAKEGRKRSLVPRSLIVSHYRIKSGSDEKRKYWKNIPISRILKENTFSDPLKEAPILK